MSAWGRGPGEQLCPCTRPSLQCTITLIQLSYYTGTEVRHAAAPRHSDSTRRPLRGSLLSPDHRPGPPGDREEAALPGRPAADRPLARGRPLDQPEHRREGVPRARDP